MAAYIGSQRQHRRAASGFAARILFCARASALFLPLLLFPLAYESGESGSNENNGVALKA